MKIILPFDDKKKFPITQYYGEKYLYGGKEVIHYGVDWAMPKGTPIISPFAGRVSKTTPNQTTGYGQSVCVVADCEEYGQLEALCAHLSVLSSYPDTSVKCGQILGYSGNTGYWRGVNGYHLHYGLKVNGKYVDPLTFYKNHELSAVNLFAPDADKKWLGTHLVQVGDTLWGIADKFYGSGAYYNEIFLANWDILKSPHLIYPGQVLKIPALQNKGI